jgi:hypothetical protein
MIFSLSLSLSLSLFLSLCNIRGRNQESVSEDPFYNGAYAAAIVTGVWAPMSVHILCKSVFYLTWQVFKTSLFKGEPPHRTNTSKSPSACGVLS